MQIFPEVVREKLLLEEMIVKYNILSKIYYIIII